MRITLDSQVQNAQLIHRQTGDDTSKRTLDPRAAIPAKFAANLNVRHGVEDRGMVGCQTDVRDHS